MNHVGWDPFLRSFGLFWGEVLRLKTTVFFFPKNILTFLTEPLKMVLSCM